MPTLHHYKKECLKKFTFQSLFLIVPNKLRSATVPTSSIMYKTNLQLIAQ